MRRFAAEVALLLGVATACLLVACSPGVGVAEPSGREDSGVENQGKAVPEIPFQDVMDSPESYVAERIRVTGSVFFFPVCPPPGAANAKCSLLGYLAHPEQRTFTSADTDTALPLSEEGVRVGCDEIGAARPAFPGWTAEATYTLVGVVEHQVVGGRETSLVQFDVITKGTPEPW